MSRTVSATNIRKLPVRSTLDIENIVQEMIEEAPKLEQRIEAMRRLHADNARYAEQISHLRELAERVIEQSELKDQRIEALEHELDAKTDRMMELVEEASTLKTRVAQLEKTLTMLAEADENLAASNTDAVK